MRYDILVPLPGDAARYVSLDVLPKVKPTETVSVGNHVMSMQELRQMLTYWHSRKCDFYFVHADRIREAKPADFPRMLRLQDMPRDWVIKREIALDAVCRGDYVSEYLAVSQYALPPTESRDAWGLESGCWERPLTTVPIACLARAAAVGSSAKIPTQRVRSSTP